ncbi:MAG: sulfite exporter TauE/SafE family protein [Desulfobacteraceae bacterium]|nr:sulfite exporter TauE/SafE family protein [Desulfobacteraceae bacterium]
MGLLPSGLSYAAFAKALASDSILSGALQTLLFGLGALPCLMLIGSGVGFIVLRYRAKTEMIAGLLMIAMAVSLILKISGL